MIAFPTILVRHAKAAGIKVPPNPKGFEPDEYPHFAVFCNMQIGSSIPYPQAVWDNAKVVAEYSDDEIRNVTAQQLIDAGYAIGRPIP